MHQLNAKSATEIGSLNTSLYLPCFCKYLGAPASTLVLQQVPWCSHSVLPKNFLAVTLHQPKRFFFSVCLGESDCLEANLRLANRPLFTPMTSLISREATPLSITTLSITTFSITTLRINGLFGTLGISDTQHNATQHNGTRNNKTLYRVPIC
jgi:hypothetical protein